MSRQGNERGTNFRVMLFDKIIGILLCLSKELLYDSEPDTVKIFQVHSHD